ncbi:hypothetical protein ABID39_000699 [Bartonella japonica]|uniref:Uncharacterized protein n=1 Tax=Bartonella japonica TaxID=357761 RepID=A0ABV2FN84_9HYPH
MSVIVSGILAKQFIYCAGLLWYYEEDFSQMSDNGGKYREN